MYSTSRNMNIEPRIGQTAADQARRPSPPRDDGEHGAAGDQHARRARSSGPAGGTARSAPRPQRDQPRAVGGAEHAEHADERQQRRRTAAGSRSGSDQVDRRTRRREHEHAQERRPLDRVEIDDDDREQQLRSMQQARRDHAPCRRVREAGLADCPDSARQSSCSQAQVPRAMMLRWISDVPEYSVLPTESRRSRSTCCSVM